MLKANTFYNIEQKIRITSHRQLFLIVIRLYVVKSNVTTFFMIITIFAFLKDSMNVCMRVSVLVLKYYVMKKMIADFDHVFSCETQNE